MKISKFLYAAGLLVVLISACKKSNDTNTPVIPVIPKADTLTSGWSKIQLGNVLTNGGDIFFKNTTTGYVCSGTGIFKSIDGGSTWNQVSNISATNIAMTADNKAFFVNFTQNTIYRTTDGGLTLTGYNLGSAKPSDIFFSDNNTGLCSTNQGLYSTIDGGNSWSSLTSLHNFSGQTTLFMLDAVNAWAADSLKILHSNGNLSNWSLNSISSSIPYLGISSIYATSANVVYVSSHSGYLFKSTDGGANFTFLLKLDDLHNLVYHGDISFTDANVGYISLGSRIYKTTDAGNTWSVVVALGNTDFVEIHFADATHGWACCTDGSILKFN